MMTMMIKTNKAVMVDGHDDKDLNIFPNYGRILKFLLGRKTRDLSIPKCPLRGRKIELADFPEEGEDGVEEVVVSILQ